MKTYSYNKEIMVATAQIQMIFNNITIKRNNIDISVPLVYGQRSRILKYLQNNILMVLFVKDILIILQFLKVRIML